MCDENSKIIDGDQIIAMLACRWKSKKILKGGVIGTMMSNYGLETFLKNEKIKFFHFFFYVSISHFGSKKTNFFLF